MNNHKMIVSFKHKKYSKKKFGTFTGYSYFMVFGSIYKCSNEQTGLQVL